MALCAGAGDGSAAVPEGPAYVDMCGRLAGEYIKVGRPADSVCLLEPVMRQCPKDHEDYVYNSYVLGYAFNAVSRAADSVLLLQPVVLQ